MTKIKILNKKQIIMIALSFILVIVAYATYNLDTPIIDVSNQIADIENYAESIGDVKLVSSQNVYEENVIDNENMTDEVMKKEEENQYNYFEESRLERDKMYSETLEVYEEILANDSIGADQKLVAKNEITAITNVKNGILIAENLIKVKGFEDVVIFINDGMGTVVVKSSELELQEIAQIQNIIIKQLGIELNNISITNREE